MGDFSRSFHRPDAGSHTVEGNVSGSRAQRQAQQRQAQQDEFEAERQKRKAAANISTLGIHDKFQTARIGGTRQEQDFRAKTVGLVSASDFLSAAQTLEKTEDTPETIRARQEDIAEEARLRAKKEKSKKKNKRKMDSLLSFMGEEEGLDDTAVLADQPLKVSKKDPTVDTSFLPDKQRQMEQVQKRKQLEQEWKEKQEKIRKESLEITFSYFDGSGHRRSATIEKGSTVGDFLEQVRQSLCTEFKELANVAADALLYVKEDLILPQDITFYDLITTKARGKSGPLFHFDVHDDVRLGPLDSRVEKDESHPGKVVERRWYERNKHIFPASRWELYDPAKEYGTYTIHGGEVNKKR